MTDYTYPENAAFLENRVMRDPALSVYGKLVYSTLACYCDPDGLAQLTRAELAMSASMSVRTAQNAVNECVRYGVLKTTRTHVGPLLYQLLDFQNVFNPRKAAAEERATLLLPLIGPPGPFPFSSPASLKRYLTVGDRDGWHCRYCSVPLANCVTRENWEWNGKHWNPVPGFAGPELDHVVPRSRGGSNSIPNLALACLRCNAIKRDHLLSELPDNWWLDEAA